MSIVLAIVLAVFAGAADARLAQAVKAGDRAAVQTLLQQRVDVNAPEGKLKHGMRADVVFVQDEQ